ncbi:MAG: hypothetical protein LBK66_12590 [Spirochaetaceae bacterium]|jgi:hypothetical protein|nr:hypothetical protein [Spirochaetaceae bacterium]
MLGKEPVKSSPASFYTEFDKGKIHAALNIGNAALINGNQTGNSLIDIGCIYNLNCDAETFFSSYKNILEETHHMSEQIFVGLLKEELLKSLNPEY